MIIFKNEAVDILGKVKEAFSNYLVENWLMLGPFQIDVTQLEVSCMYYQSGVIKIFIML